MTEDKPYRSWPGAGERAVAEEMIRDPGSVHWEKCNEFVKRYVYAKAKNIPIDRQEEVVQEIMEKVARSLPDFQFRSALKSWLIPIIEHSIIDVYRRLQKERQYVVPLEKPSEDDEREDEKFSGSEAESAEETFIAEEDFRSVLEAMLEYASIHANPVRNRLIIWMVIYEGHTHAETAEAAGCNPPVVGYVIRQAQRYARERMGE